MNKILNIPNVLSMTRIALTPVFVWFFFGNMQSQILAVLIFTIAAITDSCDGYFARKNKTQTNFGAFIDPLADKILILSVFSSFAFQHTISWWVVVILALRDLLVTQIRVRLIRSGDSFSTSYIAKLKTVFQFIGIYFLFLGSLLHNIFDACQLWLLDVFIQCFIYWLVIFSIYTCVDYVVKYAKAMFKNE
ncbi:MAG: Phosphatidylglycerophosphate synthase [candidate division TM6 bacterium GW2011_GWF2_37_49]|nr:MAG: Phosphatidylglycerophosphate synthase [candidate division TM6 bacterium GW2011_GWF2_37_49]